MILVFFFCGVCDCSVHYNISKNVLSSIFAVCPVQRRLVINLYLLSYANSFFFFLFIFELLSITFKWDLSHSPSHHSHDGKSNMLHMSYGFLFLIVCLRHTIISRTHQTRKRICIVASSRRHICNQNHCC